MLHPLCMMLAGVVFSTCAALAVADDQPGHDHKHEGEKLVPMCPVMNAEAANLTLSVDTDKGPVYFCCPGCVKKYNKNPDKYADAAKAQRAVLAKMDKVQVACPVSGETVDKKVSTEHDGNTVYFCCGDCKSKYEKEPGKYAAKLAGSYTYQTLCPVMKEPINPAVFTELPTGEKIYLCCAPCGKKLLKSPAKYNANLLEQHVHVDWDKVKEMQGG